jgi:hypothetical protein
MVHGKLEMHLSASQCQWFCASTEGHQEQLKGKAKMRVSG